VSHVLFIGVWVPVLSAIAWSIDMCRTRRSERYCSSVVMSRVVDRCVCLLLPSIPELLAGSCSRRCPAAFSALHFLPYHYSCSLHVQGMGPSCDIWWLCCRCRIDVFSCLLSCLLARSSLVCLVVGLDGWSLVEYLVGICFSASRCARGSDVCQ
jgi:hypothetical protein